MSTRGQGHCLTFVQVHTDLYFQTSSAPKPLGALKPNYVEPLWVMGTKGSSNSPGHVTKMAVMFCFFVLKFYSPVNILLSVTDNCPT